MSEPSDNKDDSNAPPQLPADGGREDKIEVLSGRPVGSKYRDVVVMLSKDDFDHLLSSRQVPTDKKPPEPTTPDEFRSIVSDVDKLGWQWTTHDPPALASKESADPDLSAFKELSNKYPRFPYELAAIIKYVLWGWIPDADLVGSASDLSVKAAIVSESILTEDYRSSFFFEHATRLRRFDDLDWEVMIKAAERNVKSTPGTIYATLSLETSETQPDFEERTETVLFAADARSLKRMIELLQGALKAVEDTKIKAHYLRHDEGGSHAE